jgi:hypothetical protein
MTYPGGLPPVGADEGVPFVGVALVSLALVSLALVSLALVSEGLTGVLEGAGAVGVTLLPVAVGPRVETTVPQSQGQGTSAGGFADRTNLS